MYHQISRNVCQYCLIILCSFVTLNPEKLCLLLNLGFEIFTRSNIECYVFLTFSEMPDNGESTRQKGDQNCLEFWLGRYDDNWCNSTRTFICVYDSKGNLKIQLLLFFSKS